MHGSAGQAAFRSMLAQLKSCAEESAALDEYVLVNATALYKVTKKFDKKVGEETIERLMERVDTEPFFVNGIARILRLQLNGASAGR